MAPGGFLSPALRGRLSRTMRRAAGFGLAAIRRANRLRKWAGSSSIGLSFLVHAAAIVIASLIVFAADLPKIHHAIFVEPFVETVEEFVEYPVAIAPAQPSVESAAASLFDPLTASETPQSPSIESPLALEARANADELGAAELPPESERPLRPTDLLRGTGEPSGGGFTGRRRPLRQQLLRERGGTPASEEAVARGLAWLALHQRTDGSWRFNHHDGPCGGQCANPGTVGSTTAATGLALLPFLGAGEVESNSPYKPVVDRGLYYLAGRMQLTPHGGDLQEGTMYAQGIATIALCEAYGMTREPSLRPLAQHAIDFICHAQHRGGGWRYYPGQPGDTTVFGWQFMAIKSARLAGLHVPREVIYKAERYLDSMQTGDGAFYGYLAADKQPTPTAVGLLSRMYLGWRQDNSALATGVGYLEKLGPSRTDMYFNYYATQVLHHAESPGWPRWNETLRERLIATQSRRGHESGSWHFRDEHGDEGGRLYTTAMCLMILEVYYRHLPLYGERAAEEF